MPRSHRSSAPTTSDHRGSAAPLVTVIIALAFACCVAVTRGASVVAERAHAQSVADAVALAAATHGVDTARRVAHITHSTVVDITFDGMFVEVTVRTHGTTATAAAVRAVDPMPPG